MKITHIRKSRHFAETLESGSMARSKMLAMYVLAVGEAKDTGLGLIIPKKCARLAVQRNFIRRLIYAQFRQEAMNAARKARIVVKLTGEVRGKSRKELSRELREELTRLFLKTGISNEAPHSGGNKGI